MSSSSLGKKYLVDAAIDLTLLSWQEGNSNLTNYLLQLRFQKSISKLKTSRWVTTAEDGTTCFSCQLRTGNWGFSLYDKIGQWRQKKKLALSGEFQFQHLVGTVRIWCNQHENMTPSCFVSLVQTPWWCNGVGAIVLTHFGPYSTGWALCKCHSLPECYCWPCIPFMTTMYPSSDGFQWENTPCHKAQKLVSWVW